MADTIAAIATGQQVAAIGIVRMSGERSIEIADRLFRPCAGGRLKDAKDRKLLYGELRSRKEELLDLCMCTISRGPQSYTGEDTVEFQCHGSPMLLQVLLKELFALGARQAGPGEFTKRAFLNGRMDLSSAEAVIDLIDAETAEAVRNAAGQLSGAIHRKATAIYDELVGMSAHFHAVLDYPDEDIEEFEIQSYRDMLTGGQRSLERLLGTFERGQMMNSGIPTAIIGLPNAGKSSLLNALLGYERAIVTDVPGTTRDTVEERVQLGGVSLRLIDTAGIRETDDRVEQLGVQRSLAAAASASLVLAVIDGNSEPCGRGADPPYGGARGAWNRGDFQNRPAAAVSGPGDAASGGVGEQRDRRGTGTAGGENQSALSAAGGAGGGDPDQCPAGGCGTPCGGKHGGCL